MTVRIPPEKILDKIRKQFGKEPKVIIPEEAGQVYKDIGLYVQIKGRGKAFSKHCFARLESMIGKKN